MVALHFLGPHPFWKAGSLHHEEEWEDSVFLPKLEHPVEPVQLEIQQVQVVGVDQCSVYIGGVVVNNLGIINYIYLYRLRDKSISCNDFK
jgi:hypothetical protein